MKHLAALAALGLAACSHTQPAVEIRTVEVPTPVACVSQEVLAEAEAGEPAPIAGTLTGSASADLPIVTALALEQKAWALDLLAIVRECSEVAG